MVVGGLSESLRDVLLPLTFKSVTVELAESRRVI